MKIKWSELHPNRVAKKFRFEKNPNGGGLSDEVFTNYYDWYWWCRSGKNVFNINQNLIELLTKSDINCIQGDQLKFPFESFYILFESKYLGFNGFYCGNIKEGNASYLGVSLTSPDSEKIYHFEIVCDDKTLDKALKERVDGLEKHVGKLTDDEISDIKNLIFNIILYLSLPKPDIKIEYPSDVPTGFIGRLKKAKNKTQKETAQRTITNAGYSTINMVGSSFTKQHLTNDETHTVATHWRRGHWRNQPYADKTTKLIWIIPMIINADKGEPAKGHLYKS